jgi:hypothetical protein
MRLWQELQRVDRGNVLSLRVSFIKVLEEHVHEWRGFPCSKRVAGKWTRGSLWSL